MCETWLPCCRCCSLLGPSPTGLACSPPAKVIKLFNKMLQAVNRSHKYIFLTHKPEIMTGPLKFLYAAKSKVCMICLFQHQSQTSNLPEEDGEYLPHLQPCWKTSDYYEGWYIKAIDIIDSVLIFFSPSISPNKMKWHLANRWSCELLLPGLESSSITFDLIIMLIIIISY